MRSVLTVMGKRPAGGGGGGLVAGAAGVYDASEIVGLANADPVVQWDDTSGNAAHLAQSDSNRRPTYRTNQINGLAVVRFDGTSDRMYASGPDAGAAAQTRFIVFKATAMGGTLVGGADAAGQYGCMGTTTGNSKLSATKEGGPTIFQRSDSLSTGTAYLATVVWEDSSDTVILRLNGNEQSSTSTQALNTRSGLSVGSHGGQYDGGYFQGDIAFVAHYNSRLSAGNITTNEQYLATRYGITI